MKCPICGETAYVKSHQIEPGYLGGRQLVSCGACAIEARRQVNKASAAKTVAGEQTREAAVTAALA